MDSKIDIKYFSTSRTDEDWGLVVTTVGRQRIRPGCSYPQSLHPNTHAFKHSTGRILDEYQLIYITDGCGYFESHSCRRRKVSAGTILLLFPGEWHSYAPDSNTGWYEYWVGFRGETIERQVKAGYFTPQEPIFHIGSNHGIIGLYDDIIAHTAREETGFQQLVASIVQMMLGTVYFRFRNSINDDSFARSVIQESRNIMKQSIDTGISPQEIARRLSVGYSWFRKTFKKYTDVSPAQYMSHLRFLKAKEMLESTDLTMAEIAFSLNFDSPSHFASFFRKIAAATPSQYRCRFRNSTNGNDTP